MSRKASRGCGSTFIGCFTAGILVFVAIGVALYIFVPPLLKDADRKVVPWLESKGRILLGRLALNALIQTIERSEMTPSEKAEWKEFLVEKWELGWVSQDQKLRRDILIDAARETVGSESGMYYGLLAIGERNFEGNSLTKSQNQMGKDLITKITSRMADGAYSREDLAPLESNLHSLLSGWTITTENKQGQVEQDNNLRNLFRSLHRLNEKAIHGGNNRKRNMPAEFAEELSKFKSRVYQEERENESRFRREAVGESQMSAPANRQRSNHKGQ